MKGYIYTIQDMWNLFFIAGKYNVLMIYQFTAADITCQTLKANNQQWFLNGFNYDLSCYAADSCNMTNI